MIATAKNDMKPNPGPDCCTLRANNGKPRADGEPYENVAGQYGSCISGICIRQTLEYTVE